MSIVRMGSAGSIVKKYRYSMLITIANLSEKVVPVSDPGKSVLHNLQHDGLDWMHACGGKGRCTTCKITILGGAENLSPFSEPEQRYRNLGALRDGERLTCQTRTTGDIRIAVPDASKLPHIAYSF